jgi:hypothetical protein
MAELGRSFLQIRAFFSHDRAFHWADLQTNTAINAGREVNPIPRSPLLIFAGAVMNAGHWAGFHAIGNAFANIGDDSMCHDFPS